MSKGRKDHGQTSKGATATCLGTLHRCEKGQPFQSVLPSPSRHPRQQKGRGRQHRSDGTQRRPPAVAASLPPFCRSTSRTRQRAANIQHSSGKEIPSSFLSDIGPLSSSNGRERKGQPAIDVPTSQAELDLVAALARRPSARPTFGRPSAPGKCCGVGLARVPL